MRRAKRYVWFWLVLGVIPAAVPAAGGGGSLDDADLDRTPAELRRGARTAVNLCMLCHSLKYIRYRDLHQLGFEPAQIEALRGAREPESSLKSTTPPAQAQALYGLVPPDLSLITLAREGGVDYVYSVMTGYYRTEQGAVDNHVFPGIAMPDVLGISVAPSPEQRARIEDRARDVTAFLEWAADPRAPERRRMGYGVIAYLILLTVLLYVVKRRVWARLDSR